MSDIRARFDRWMSNTRGGSSSDVREGQAIVRAVAGSGEMYGGDPDAEAWYDRPADVVGFQDGHVVQVWRDVNPVGAKAIDIDRKRTRAIVAEGGTVAATYWAEVERWEMELAARRTTK